MAKGPIHTFRELIASGEMTDDAAQRFAVEKLQLLHTQIEGYNAAKPTIVGLGLFGWGREKIKKEPIKGLYLYGGVGRGKSMLMDLFFYTANVEKKRRVHFHEFMQEVHDGIHEARKKYDKDPIEPVANAIADSAHLLCFDEMQIVDITDAMIVGRLFKKLFARGVVIVATSNRHPDELYKDGLNRYLFAPFIEEIKARIEVYHLASNVDHRLGGLKSAELYHTPLDEVSADAMDAAWVELAGGKGVPKTLKVKGRDVVIPSYFKRAGRFTFHELCETPLGAGDYLAISSALNVLILDDIPKMSKEKGNEAKRFILLIDTLYEAKVRLIASAADVPDRLYQEGRGAWQFKRTTSRLEEMQTVGWGVA
ncbi:MAG: cell division protein ZapE [Paracoccaceae bacterium]